MSALIVESIPLLNEIKEALELSYSKTKAKNAATIDKDSKEQLSKKEKRISELLFHIYNILPACSNSSEI